jgi:chromosome partitioning protein
MYRTYIPRSIKLGEAPSHGRTIFEHDASGTAAQAYLALGREFLQRHGISLL